MSSKFVSLLLKITKASDCEELEIIQSLWSGYGKISRYQLYNSPYKTVVVKHISLEEVDQHPRGWNTNISHNRKVKSYNVETNWYGQWSQLCDENCRIPRLLDTYAEGKNIWIVLEDLNHEFPLRKYQVNIDEVKVCLKWLANFHSKFLGHVPKELWSIGTYWHLDTRPDEFKKIDNQELKSKAHIIDNILNECKFKTIVHGDAKLANFCFSDDGKKVAAVDFQYVGGGCGMKDIAYFLGSCLSSSECEQHEAELLDYYFFQLESAIKIDHENIEFEKLHKEWMKMYPLACTDFTRFMLGWMPSHQKVNSYNLNKMNIVLATM